MIITATLSPVNSSVRHYFIQPGQASTCLGNFTASLFSLHFLFMWSKKTSVGLLRNNNLTVFRGCNFGAFYLVSELKYQLSFILLPGVNPPLTSPFTFTIQYSTPGDVLVTVSDSKISYFYLFEKI